jgi:sec-independent protein translocase protein TatC
MTSPISSPRNDEPEAEKKPLLEHLIELRRRVSIMLIAYFAAVGVCYAFSDSIYAFLVQPLADSFPDAGARRLIYTNLTEAFFTYLKLSMFAGVFLAFPVIAAQGYAFVAPGLYGQEKRVLLPYLAAAPILFLAGAALCYYYIFPLAWHFFLSFEGASAAGMQIQLEAKVSEYLSLVMHLVLAFGISFQLPVVLALLTQAGMLEAKSLKKGRRFAIVGIAAVAAVITPPDVFSMVALAVPLTVLYEASVLLCGVIERKKARQNPDYTYNT